MHAGGVCMLLLCKCHGKTTHVAAMHPCIQNAASTAANGVKTLAGDPEQPGDGPRWSANRAHPLGRPRPHAGTRR
jgi:hypothetical protein